MAAFDPEFNRRPETYVRQRSWPRTVIFLVLAILAAAILVYVLVNFADLREDAAQQTGSTRRTVGRRLGTLVAPLFLALVVIALLIAAARWGRVWKLVRSGNPLRRRHYSSAAGGRAVYDSLLRAFQTHDPAFFTPLPPQPSHTNVEIEFWTSKEDRLGLATLVLYEGKNNKERTFSEPVVFEGADYDALEAALKRGLTEASAPR
ncbi:hypothetical protein KZC52_11840 [Microbacterium sp. kSW2-24]|uniref:hypothetical protein n=1 Tax=Microbacterium galbinum TaxID=2851646 RepID=UPI001FFD0B12|nr:hypothetical protein [Microbacterium galbinum]MCK2023620.1 hypothetical protein [Microbacterium galbinum]